MFIVVLTAEKNPPRDRENERREGEQGSTLRGLWLLPSGPDPLSRFTSTQAPPAILNGTVNEPLLAFGMGKTRPQKDQKPVTCVTGSWEVLGGCGS
jgi:hypothetical protein